MARKPNTQKTPVQQVPPVLPKGTDPRAELDAFITKLDEETTNQLSGETTMQNDTSIVIRSDRPIPSAMSRGKPRYPFETMQVGDSFFVPGGKVSSFYTNISTWSKKTGYKYIARALTEDGVEGVCVWRVS